MTAKQPLVVGMDFGTPSARATAARAGGAELAAASDQAPADGSGSRAAIAAGMHADVTSAPAVMGRAERAAYVPGPARADAYDELFAEYRTVHDYFSVRREWAGNHVLHRLRSRRNGANPE